MTARRAWCRMSGPLGPLAVAATLAPGCVAGAQAPAAAAPHAYAWEARASYGRETFASSAPAWSPWESAGVAVGRRFAAGALIVEALRVRRFDREDEAAAADAYRRLWRGAYANLRVQAVAGDEVLPRADVALELFQALPGGWESSASARQMRFRAETVHLLSVSLAKALGDGWDLRGRATWVPPREADGGAGTGTSFAAIARRRLGAGVEFLELGAGGGREIVSVGAESRAGALVDVRRTTFVAASARKYVARHLGGMLSASVNTFQEIPTRAGGTAGLLVRW